MAAGERASVLEQLQPYRENALDGHPWRDWAEAAIGAAEAGGRMPGGLNRWNANKDMSWEPLRVELVAEVAYEGLTNGRFRHNARFRRFRSDRDPSSCRYDQLEVVAPEELKAVFGAGS
jgi:hypothetical protein